MMGKDVERILAGINAVKDATTLCIDGLANVTAYRLESHEYHLGIPKVPCYPLEVPVPSPASTYVNPIRSAMSTISTDRNKMNTLARGLYTSINSFNNEYGSPWTELNKLEDAIKSAEVFAAAHSELEWLGEKDGLLGLLNKVLTLSIDAKWALIHYHDYIQRGYDNIFNGKIPSIKFKKGLNQESIGNVDQNYNENVNTEKPSIDPF